MLYGWSKAGGDLLTRSESACNGFTQHNGSITALKANFLAEDGMSGGPVFEGSSLKLVAIMSATVDKTDLPRPIELATEMLESVLGAGSELDELCAELDREL